MTYFKIRCVKTFYVRETLEDINTISSTGHVGNWNRLTQCNNISLEQVRKDVGKSRVLYGVTNRTRRGS